MKKLLIFIILILFVNFFSIYVIAEDNDKFNSAISNSDDDDDEDEKNDKATKIEEKKDDEKDSEKEFKETKTIIDEQGREVTVETKTETENGKIETEEKRTFIDEQGNKVTIETETKTKNGETETEVKRKIVTPDGREIVFKTETEVKDGKTETKTSVEIEGIGFETKLEVKEKTEEGKTKLTAKLSTGVEQEIITTPDEVLKTALAEIGGKNITIELTEIVKGNQREAVFKAKTTNPGRFLGIFNVNVDLETLIDTQTGQTIKTNRPWWAFLVTGHNKATVCHITDEPKKRTTINIAIPAVKAHLAHGDTIGACNPVCGDGFIDDNEQCDDANTINGDGCNSLCQIEVKPTQNETKPTNETTNETQPIIQPINQTNITI